MGWCKRNPVVAGLMAAVAVLLLSGTVISSALAVQSSHRADEALSRRTTPMRRLPKRCARKTVPTTRPARPRPTPKKPASRKPRRASYKRRQEGLERLLMNLDGRLERYGSAISSVRLEFLNEFLKLGQELMEDNQKEPTARLQTAQLHRRIGEVWLGDNDAQAEKVTARPWGCSRS